MAENFVDILSVEAIISGSNAKVDADVGVAATGCRQTVLHLCDPPMPMPIWASGF